MKIFVTGGTGFLGRPFVRRIERDNEVKLLESRLEHRSAAQEEIQAFSPDIVVHLAWQGLPDYSEATCAVNRDESIAFLDLLSALDIKKVLAIGSCWQYKAREGSKMEKDEFADADFFTAAKNAVFHHGISLAEKNRTTFVWPVPFFIYGPGQRKESLIPSLIATAEQHECPTPRSIAWNDMIFVDDVAEALALLCEIDVSNGSYNIGSGTLTGTYDIARMIAEHFKIPAPAMPHDTPHGMCADATKIQKATGWRPKTDFTTGLEKTLKLCA